MAQFFRYPPTASVIIAAAGIPGQPAPSIAIEVAGVDDNGDLRAIRTDTDGTVYVASADPTIAQHVIVDSSALPTGASTEAKQDAAITLLTGIEVNTSDTAVNTADTITAVQNVGAQLPATLGAKVSASSLSVVLATDQVAVPVSGPLTDAELRASPVDVDTGLVQGLTDAELRASPVLVSGTVSTGGLTDAELRASPVPVSVSGVATAANQATEIASLASIDGKLANNYGVATGALRAAAQVGNASGAADFNAGNVSAQTLRTVIASDQPAINTNSAARTPTAGTIAQAAITVGTSAVRLTVSGSAPNAARSVLVVTPDDASTAKFYIGSSSVTNSGATRGAQIVAGQSFIANNDAGDYYIISDTAAQTVYVMEQA